MWCYTTGKPNQKLKNMNSSPLVSVLMTAYNRQKYIQLAIESVVKSTYENWELIILDDCSRDNTVEIAKKYEAIDKRIKVFKNPTNLGQFKNRNKIVDYAQGKYIKFLDSDDLIYPFGIEQLVFYMEMYPDAGYGLCSIEQNKDYIFPIKLNPEESYIEHFKKDTPIFHKAPLSSIIKTDVFRNYGGFPHEAVSGDFAMWCELSQKNDVILMPHGIVWYRIHGEQEMQKTRDNVLVEFEYMKVEEYYLKHKDCPLNTKIKDELIKINQQKQIKYIIWKLRQLGIQTAIKLWNYKQKPFKLNKPSN